MSVSIGSLQRGSLGGGWLGRLCLSYVNRLQQSLAGQFIEMWTDLSRPIEPVQTDLRVRTLHEAGGVSKLIRLHNQAYVGAPDFRPAGWVEAIALQTAKGYDPTLVFIGFVEGEPVGFCMCRKHGEIGRVTGLAVRPEWRRNGYGAALLLQGLAEIKARGATTAYLSAAADCPEARRFYRRLGFHQ